MEEAAIHACALEDAHGAGIGVRQDGLGAVGGDDVGEARGDLVEGFIPGDAAELAGTLGAGALEGVLEAIGMVVAIEILCYFAAEEALGDGVGGVALEASGATGGGIDLNEHGASIGAIESADGGVPVSSHRVRVTSGQNGFVR